MKHALGILKNRALGNSISILHLEPNLWRQFPDERQKRVSQATIVFAAIGLIAVLGCIGVFTYWASVTHWRLAESVVRIGPDKGMTLDKYKLYKETNARLMTSRLVLLKAAESPVIASILSKEPNPVEHLRRHLSVHYSDETELVRVQFSGSDGDSSAAVLNGVVNAYLEALTESHVDIPNVQVLKQANVP